MNRFKKLKGVDALVGLAVTALLTIILVPSPISLKAC